MTSSNVRSIESLERFHETMIQSASDWEAVVQELRMMVHRAEAYFGEDRPRYWRHQTQLAEQHLNEAKDQLAQKRSAVRAQDRPAATEAVKKVQLAEQRLRLCETKARDARSWAIEIRKQCSDVLGPLADVAQHCEVGMPSAATELRGLIEQLKAYAEKS